MPDDLRPSPVARPLGEVVGAAGAGVVAGDPETSVTGITHDSRAVRGGDLYAALPGFSTHGARFAGQAVGAGAVAILTDPAGESDAVATGAVVVVCDDPRGALGEVSARVYGRPADDLLMIGVTGTNGKTTTAYLLESGLRAAGWRTGVIGTVGTRIGDTAVATARTTPEATDLHALLAVMRERGVRAVAMEVSSHALVLGRVDGITFDQAVFTNLTQDHLDFHGTMADYYAAKASLFTPARAAGGVVCVDDGWGRRLAASAEVPVVTYSVPVAVAVSGAAAVSPGDWTATSVVTGPSGSTFTAVGPGATVPASVSLPGAYNVANALGAIAALVAVGVEPATAADGVAACPGVPGRMERVDVGQTFTAIVDYAHTPDAVAGALDAVRPVTAGRLVAVLGCGGDRDHDKRPHMGRMAAERADVVIVTDDNPRSEDAAAIRATVLAGARGDSSRSGRPAAEVREVPGRRPAIEAAVALVGEGDTVIVLGKGHEQGQEVAGTVHPFDDRAVLAEAIDDARRRGAAR